jgi:hypothetical protein
LSPTSQPTYHGGYSYIGQLRDDGAGVPDSLCPGLHQAILQGLSATNRQWLPGKDQPSPEVGQVVGQRVKLMPCISIAHLSREP